MLNVTKHTAALAYVIVVVLAVIANAQSKPAAGQIPRTADGKPDGMQKARGSSCRASPVRGS